MKRDIDNLNNTSVYSESAMKHEPSSIHQSPYVSLMQDNIS